MFERYIDYRQAVISILRSRKQAEVELENARTDYENICQTIEGVGAAGSGTGGSVGREASFVKRVEKKEMLERKIALLEAEGECIRRALDALQPDERAVVEILYAVKHKSQVHARRDACEAACCEQSQMYRLRASALHKLKGMIFLD